MAVIELVLPATYFGTPRRWIGQAIQRLSLRVGMHFSENCWDGVSVFQSVFHHMCHVGAGVSMLEHRLFKRSCHLSLALVLFPLGSARPLPLPPLPHIAYLRNGVSPPPPPPNIPSRERKGV